MKQIKPTPLRERMPSMADHLKSLKVGESAKMRLLGRIYQNYYATRSKLQKAGVGQWVHEISKNGEEMIITRTA